MVAYDDGLNAAVDTSESSSCSLENNFVRGFSDVNEDVCWHSRLEVTASSITKVTEDNSLTVVSFKLLEGGKVLLSRLNRFLRKGEQLAAREALVVHDFLDSCFAVTDDDNRVSSHELLGLLDNGSGPLVLVTRDYLCNLRLR